MDCRQQACGGLHGRRHQHRLGPAGARSGLGAVLTRGVISRSPGSPGAQAGVGGAVAREHRLVFELQAGPLSAGDLTVTRLMGEEALSELFEFQVIAVAEGPGAIRDRLTCWARRWPSRSRWAEGSPALVSTAWWPAGGLEGVGGPAVHLPRPRRGLAVAATAWPTQPHLPEALGAGHPRSRCWARAGGVTGWRSPAPTRRASTACSTARRTSTSSRGCMEEEGIFFYFEHAGDQHELVLGDSSQRPRPLCGVNGTLPFRRRRGQAPLGRASRMRRVSTSPSSCTPPAWCCGTSTSRRTRTMDSTRRVPAAGRVGGHCEFYDYPAPLRGYVTPARRSASTSLRRCGLGGAGASGRGQALARAWARRRLRRGATCSSWRGTADAALDRRVPAHPRGAPWTCCPRS